MTRISGTSVEDKYDIFVATQQWKGNPLLHFQCGTGSCIYKTTIKTGRIFVLPWQQWLLDVRKCHAVMLYSIVYIVFCVYMFTVQVLYISI